MPEREGAEVIDEHRFAKQWTILTATQQCEAAETMNITIERAVEATPEVRALLRELNDVLGAAYESHQRHGLSIEQLFEPHLRFFVARLDGIAVGCGGVAMFDDYAEVKRMYTRSAVRGRGVAKALLYRIEHEARGAGKSVLRLETGIQQQEAMGLYQRGGFDYEVHLANMRQCLPATSRRACFSKRSLRNSRNVDATLGLCRSTSRRS